MVLRTLLVASTIFAGSLASASTSFTCTGDKASFQGEVIVNGQRAVGSMVINAKVDQKSLGGAVDFKAGYIVRQDTVESLAKVVNLNGKQFLVSFGIINLKSKKAIGKLMIAEPDPQSEDDVYVKEENMTCTR